ncbi:site-specific integrase [Solimonas fluminis]|uniref:Site-specific integrase n=1 Tax=Solimonas fluminis TaxID=2086571 RepID=A0A2S5TCK4_9GAMM|nr:site-specific integrase [Solimonas fluminis]MDM4771008.1 site-specific integrase [Solimonas sp. SE-A11]PPE72733.1 site-specific integrase [Solimonas fluminis]
MARKKTGSIRHRGPLQFRAAVTVGGREKSKTFSTAGEAEAWIQGLLKADAANAANAWLASQEVTLRAGFKRYLAEITPQKKSAASEKRLIEAFLAREAVLCEKPLCDIAPSDMKALVQRRMKPSDPVEKPITGSTMNRELARISHLYTVAVAEWEYVGLVNPITRGIRRRENKPRERRLEIGEEEKLLEAARSYELDCAPEIPISAVIRFALGSSMRLSEIGRCEWKHVDLEQATILLPATKNGSARTVALWPHLVRLLSTLARRNDGLVFGPTESIRLMFTRVMARTDIKGLRFHDLRHEAISRFFERTSLSDMEIAAISGHKTLSMLKRYAHLRANKLAMKLATSEAAEPLPLTTVMGGSPVH